MHLAVRVFGFEVFAVTTDPPVFEEACSLDGGTTSAYPIGYGPPPAALREDDWKQSPYYDE